MDESGTKRTSTDYQANAELSMKAGDGDKICASFSANQPNDTKHVSLNSNDSTKNSMIVQQQPHTLRLLRLIRDGTKEHAHEAAIQLSALASSSSLSPIQLWDILGRLQENLTCPRWKTRTNAALALEGVAKHIPIADQYEFLSSNEYQKYTTTDESANSGSKNELFYLKIKDICDPSTLDKILSEGRLLMSTSGCRFDSNEDETIDNFDRRVLAQQHTNNDSSSIDNSYDFVEHRISLQRRIMAQRLGLSELSDLTGDSNFFLDEDYITLDDIQSIQPRTETVKSNKRRKLLAAKIQLENQNNLQQQQQKEQGEEQSITTVRALLVMEMDRSSRKESGTGNASMSHRSPQSLLANELIYRMLDPNWHIRHGALLGILSLLRAWKAYSPCSNTNSSNVRYLGAVDSSLDDNRRNGSCYRFGVWPEDILARCICVLALDRFGDFSGALLEDNENAMASSVTTGGVIAPVREVAGQVVSLLVAMAPTHVKDDTLVMLHRLVQPSTVEWEVRHGSLIAEKFMTALLFSNAMLVKETQKFVTLFKDEDMKDVRLDDDWNIRFLHEVIKSASSCLSDESDDVKGVAAQILTEIIVGFRNQGENVGYISPQINDPGLYALIWDDVPQPLWRVLKSARAVSSSIVDLVSLFSVMIEKDCSMFLKSIIATSPVDEPGHIASSFTEITKLVLRLLDSEFLSVRLSALRSISSLAKSFCPEAKEAHAILIGRLFELFYSFWDDLVQSAIPEHTNNNNVIALRDKAWRLISDAAHNVFESAPEALMSIESNLIMKYFDINCERVIEATDISREVQAADALTIFIHGCRIPERISLQVEMAVRLFMRSPWMYQFESCCLLYRALSKKFGPENLVLQSIPTSFDTTDQPLCLQFAASVAQNFINDSSLVRLCGHAFFQSLLIVNDGLRTPLEAESATLQFWLETVEQRCPSLTRCPREKPSIHSMRIEATHAGVVVARGLPEKITPVVRALMTSFMNEASSVSRQVQTSVYLLDLLQIIRNKGNYENAQNKIISTLCDRAVQEARVFLSHTSHDKPASCILQSLIRNLKQDESLSDLRPLWHRLVILTQSFDSTTEDRPSSEALYLLHAVSSALAMGQFDLFLPVLVKYCCEHISEDLRCCASFVIQDLCTFNSGYILHQTLPLVAKCLSDSDLTQRLHACILLRSIVLKVGKDICPFIRSLIPFVLSLMTDPTEECAKTANSVFALLVQFAPLVQQNTSASFSFGPCYSYSQKVMDHLIFGKPLPPCILPKEVDDCLKLRTVELRKYQLEGISWLRFLQNVNVNGLLCDSMGLGKSLQALVSIALCHFDKGDRYVHEEPVSLIVCPSTLVGHWLSEIEKYFPGEAVFRPFCLTGNSATRQSLWREKSGQCNVVITSYSVLRSDIDSLKNMVWCYCVLDEGHLLKNPNTATSRSSKSIKAHHKLILTGTPIQNRIHELWAAFDFLMPNFLGSSSSFQAEFAGPITRSQMPNASASCIASGTSKLKILHQKVLPFILRREKEQVLPELPPKNIIDVQIHMTALQSKLYNEICSRSEVHRALMALDETLMSHPIENSDVLSMTAEGIKSLLLLRLLCTHPALLLKGEARIKSSASWQNYAHSAKLLALAQLLCEAGLHDDEITAADNDTSLVYCEQGSEERYDYLKDFNSNEEIPSFGQFAKVESDSKCLIFAQFTSSLDIVENLLFKHLMPSLRYLRLDGKVPTSMRTGLVDRFNQDSSIKVMLLTTRVGGLGLNLTRANMVIFLELDYNPFADLQAMDRAHRLGQHKTVNVYKIITKDSIEEKIVKLQEKKIAMSQTIINTDNSTMFSMGTDRILDVFTFQTIDEEGTNDVDLDSLLTRCYEDYASLSVEHFTQSLV